jgi:hypothetical protein
MLARTIALFLVISLPLQFVAGVAHAASPTSTSPTNHEETPGAQALPQPLPLLRRPESRGWELHRKADAEFHFLPYFEEPQRQVPEKVC